MRLHRLPLARLGKLLDAQSEADCAEQYHRRDHRGAEFENLRLETPRGEHVVHRQRDDRGDRKPVGIHHANMRSSGRRR